MEMIMIDSSYRSDDKIKEATVTRSVVYTVKYYNKDELLNQTTYYTQDLAENSAEDYVLERK
jgi:hypothetical protein